MDATAPRRVLGGRGPWWPRTGLFLALVLAGLLVQGCTDNNGRVTGTESKVTGDAVGGNIKVSVTINPGAIDRGRRGSVVVIVSSPNGFPIGGRRVDLSSVGGRLDATSGVTGADGRFSTTLYIPCETGPGAVTVTAFADNQSQVAATATANAVTAVASDPCAGIAGTPPPGGGGGGGGGGTPTLPTVSITASGLADEDGPVSANFTVTGSSGITVSLGISGTATIGVDYNLTGTGVLVVNATTVNVTLSGGSATITVAPLADAADADDPLGPATDAERVVLTINASPSYTVGSPSVAAIEICDAGASCP
jgi:hypothetical protein